MRKSLLISFTAALLALGTATAQSARWSGADIPTSVEIVPNFNSSRVEIAPILAVYLSTYLNPFVMPIDTDKGKAILETIRQAFLQGKRLNIYYDDNFNMAPNLCDDWDNLGNCVRTVGTNTYRRIQRISMQ